MITRLHWGHDILMVYAPSSPQLCRLLANLGGCSECLLSEQREEWMNRLPIFCYVLAGRSRIGVTDADTSIPLCVWQPGTASWCWGHCCSHLPFLPLLKSFLANLPVLRHTAQCSFPSFFFFLSLSIFGIPHTYQVLCWCFSLYSVFHHVYCFRFEKYLILLVWKQRPRAPQPMVVQKWMGSARVQPKCLWFQMSRSFLYTMQPHWIVPRCCSFISLCLPSLSCLTGCFLTQNTDGGWVLEITLFKGYWNCSHLIWCPQMFGLV